VLTIRNVIYIVGGECVLQNCGTGCAPSEGIY